MPADVADPSFRDYYMRTTSLSSFGVPPPVSPESPASPGCAGTAYTWIKPTTTSLLDAAVPAEEGARGHAAAVERQAYYSTSRVEMGRPCYAPIAANVLQPERFSAGYTTAVGSRIFAC